MTSSVEAILLLLLHEVCAQATQLCHPSLPGLCSQGHVLTPEMTL